MNALDVVSIYVVTNRAPYLKCDPSVSIYVVVAFTPNHPTDPDLREGLCQTMLLVTMSALNKGCHGCFPTSGLQPILEQFPLLPAVETHAIASSLNIPPPVYPGTCVPRGFSSPHKREVQRNQCGTAPFKRCGKNTLRLFIQVT